MSETDPKGVARAYLAALGAKDYDAVGALLHPDLEFRGAMITFDNAADFLAGVRMLEPINERVDIKSLIAEGGAVSAQYDLVTSGPMGTSRMSEHYTVEDGKIRAIELYFDPRPWGA